MYGKKIYWFQDNHPIELSSNEMMDQRLEYIHNNPVEAGFVDDPTNWLHSSARDYAGMLLIAIIYLMTKLQLLILKTQFANSIGSGIFHV